MGEWDIECLDCGWRGAAADLVAETDESSGKKITFCPDCGGSGFADRVDQDDGQNT